ncbi:MAG: dihydrolipoyl dehydrogenase [Nitrososphaeria archaeon]|nr:dihydrolipoyl dehydrogenase [Nitrososphaeria archaeon]
MRDMDRYGAVVIGGGPGGYVAAIRLAQLGLKTAIIEKEFIGGECLNYGCIPSKILIENVNQYYRLSRLGFLKGGEIDWSYLQEKKRKLVKKIREGVEFLLKGYNVKLYLGKAVIKSDSKIRLEERDGSVREIVGENIVLSTGASQASLQSIPYDGKRVIMSKEALELGKVPERLLVIGGGAIGLELGTMYAKLGTDVTIVEIMDQLLPGVDRDIAKIIERKLKEIGVKIHLSSKVASSQILEDRVKTIIETPNEMIEENSEYVLLAVGKKPLTRDIGLEDLKIALDEKGFIKVDKYCKTSIENIYAVGDVTGPPFLAHKASRQGIVAAENIAGRKKEFDPSTIPLAIFTDPEIALVGLSREEAEKKNYKVKISRFSYSSLGRAIAEEETEGFIRIISDQEKGTILGVQIVGSRATELIGEASLAVKNKLTVEQLSETIHPHPTFSEIYSEVAEASIFKPIHMLVK